MKKLLAKWICKKLFNNTFYFKEKRISLIIVIKTIFDFTLKETVDIVNPYYYKEVK